MKKLTQKKVKELSWSETFIKLPKTKRSDFLISVIKLNQSDALFLQEVVTKLNKLISKNKLNYKEVKDYLKLEDNPDFKYIISTVEHDESIAYIPMRSEKQLERINALISESHLSEAIAKEYREMLIIKYPGDDALAAIHANAQEGLPEDRGAIVLFSEFLDYINALRPKYRKKVAEGVQSVLFSQKRFSKSFINELFNQKTKLSLGFGDKTYSFFKQQHKLNKAFEAERKRLIKKSLKKSKTIGSKQRKKIKEDSYFHREYMRETHNRCFRNSNGMAKNQMSSQAHRKNTKRFRNFSLMMGLGIVGSGFYYVNKDAPWDESGFNKMHQALEFELRWVVISQLLKVFVATNKGLTFLPKFFMYYGFSALKDFAYSGEIAMRFADSKGNVDELYQKLLDDPEYSCKVEELVKQYKEDKFVERYYYAIVDMLKGQEIPTGGDLLSAVQTKDDLNKPEVQEAIHRLLARELYQQSRKKEETAFGIDKLNLPKENTGFAYSDLYSFHRKYAIFTDIKNIALSIHIFNMLCMNSSNPTMSYIKAGAVVVLDKLIFTNVYYALRNSVAPSSMN